MRSHTSKRAPGAIATAAAAIAVVSSGCSTPQSTSITPTGSESRIDTGKKAERRELGLETEKQRLDPRAAARIFHGALGTPSGGNTRSPLLDMKKRGMPPLRSERLAEPLLLPSCPGVQVIEWRPTPGRESATGPIPAAVSIIDEACRAALDGFAAFLADEGIDLPRNPAPYHASLCLMPATGPFGGSYRNLNDASFRFVSRQREYDDDGELFPIWGYFQPATNNIYIRNDVLHDDGSRNDYFFTVLAHELFHMMSRHHGVYRSLPGDRNAHEHALAARFTESLGYGR